MSERRERFQVEGTPRLVLRVPSGEARLVAGRAGEVVVRCRGSERLLGRITIERRGDTISVGPEGGGFGHWPSLELEVELGAAPEVRARLGSACLVARTPVRSLEAAGASGDVSIEAVERDLTVRLASGDLEAGSVGGRADVVTASGRVRVGRIGGSAEVKAASGEVALGTVGGDCLVRTASGGVRVGRFEGSRCEAKTVSGDIRLGVPRGRRYTVALQSLSGEVRTDFPVSADAGTAPGRLAATSVSGDIWVGAAGEG